MDPKNRQRRQRERLETLADVVYGVAIVLIVAALPTPQSEGFEGTSFVDFVLEHYELILAGAVGLFLIVTYWIQNNAVNGILSHTDNRHSGLGLAQLIAMLFYFYAIGLSEDLQHPPAVLAIQSGALALMGVLGIAGLAHASGKGRLLEEGVSAADLRALRVSQIPEPLTAALTMPVALLGLDAWSLAWLGYPLVAFAVSRIAGSAKA